MIVDCILNRKYDEEHCDPYNAHDFYYKVMRYLDDPGDYAARITSAMDYGTERDVKRELNRYIEDQEYSPDISAYIYSVDWL